ncbi:MAG: heavy-metal-associated domain-containing protein [Candidatus Vogelbacteria bacterium]|nr:heavy-metal-associated domain-containing protein [Candidatus Vogelbacteria bacterium]
MEKLEMTIEGMHCGACATGIQMITSQLDGVKSVFVDYNGKKGTWEIDPAKASKEQIQKAIADLGYSAS